MTLTSSVSCRVYLSVRDVHEEIVTKESVAAFTACDSEPCLEDLIVLFYSSFRVCFKFRGICFCFRSENRNYALCS